MAGKKPAPKHVAIQPVASPSMDRPSIALGWFLDSIVLTELGGFYTMDCTLCGDEICELSEGLSLRVIFNTALAHDCE